MNEEELQKRRRDSEEEATASRAHILGLDYLDTRNFENDAPLVRDLLDVSEMHKSFIIPLAVGGGGAPYEFMVTSQTPRSALDKLQRDAAKAGGIGGRRDFHLDGQRLERAEKAGRRQRV